MDIKFFIFICIALVGVVSAGVVAFSRNMIYSAFALLGVFVGVLGLYVMLSADFVAVVQLVVYIGGVLALILFAVMLTAKIEAANGKKKLMNRAMEPVPALIGVAILGGLLIKAIHSGVWIKRITENFQPTTNNIGGMLLQTYLLPFEIISLLLVLALVGAVLLARREVK